MKIEKGDYLKNKPLEAKVALCLWISARVNKKPKYLDEVLHYTSATQSQVKACLAKTRETVFSGVDIRQRPEDIIDKVIWKLRLTEELRRLAKETAEKLTDQMQGKPPKTIASVALYRVSGMASEIQIDHRDLINRIAEAVGITTITIKNNARNVARMM